MPQALGRTRSDTLRQTTLRLPPNDPKRKRAMPAAQNQDVIELSSDEDSRPPARKKTTSRRKPTTAAATAEVLEISDSDDVPSKTRPSTSKVDASAQRIKSLRSENEDLKKQLYKLRKDNDSEKARITKLQRDVADRDKKLSKVSNTGLGDLDEELLCEICTLKMWTPYLLSECGHVFCQECLTNWFNSARTQHLNAHPAYMPLPVYFQNVMRNPVADPHTFLQAAVYLAQHPPPQYTCPTCRKAVTRKPVEDYTLKKVVSWVAGAMGEQAPKTPAAANPWDSFFIV